MHFLRDFGQVLIIQLDQQHDAGPSLTRTRRCCLLRKHSEKPGDFTPPRRASCCPTPKIAFPLAGTSCVENKQWDTNSSQLCKACFLWITPAFSFFFHPETLFADPLPLLHSDCQHSNPCAYCRLPRGCISAWCKYTSWPDKSTTIISECLLRHPVMRGERSRAVLKIPLLYDNISCFHPSRIQAAICYLQDFPCQHN